jgi:hypothetical protein
MVSRFADWAHVHGLARTVNTSYRHSGARTFGPMRTTVETSVPVAVLALMAARNRSTRWDWTVQERCRVSRWKWSWVLR